MKNIAIVCDSSISFTNEEIEKYDVFVVPNIIMHNEKEYLDLVTINNQELYSLLKQNETVTTSQPNLGDVIETFEKIKEGNYDHVIVLTISSALSGGFNAFNQGAKQSGIKNCTVIDTKTVGGPVQQAIKAIRKLNEEGKSLEEIFDFLDYLFAHQSSYIIPETLHQIVASGRLSKTAGKLATLLKVKVALLIDSKGETIDRLAVARTDKKLFDSIVNHIVQNGVKPEGYDLYFLESDAMKQVEAFKDYVLDKIGKFKYEIKELPAGLSVHAGVGTIVLQWCPKIPV